MLGWIYQFTSDLHRDNDLRLECGWDYLWRKIQELSRDSETEKSFRNWALNRTLQSVIFKKYEEYDWSAGLPH